MREKEAAAAGVHGRHSHEAAGTGRRPEREEEGAGGVGNSEKNATRYCRATRGISPP